MGALVVKRVLMVAFHFPPLRGSSGIQRTLKFAQYLPQFGWKPVVISAHPRAYVNQGNDQMGDIPSSVEVHRPFAIDTSRHLSFKGRYPLLLSLPDRWVGWALGAIPRGLRLAWRDRPAVLWSTYPIATAHLIGLCLHRLTGIPWVADLRDPMTDIGHPANPSMMRAYLWIEKQTIKHCTRAVCTTPGAIKTYEGRFPAIPREKFVLIENAFDEENFAEAEKQAAAATAGGPFTLVHSGVIYPSERDPVPLFKALAALLADGTIVPGKFALLLRATGHDDYLRTLIDQHGIAGVVQLAPHIAYRDALREMLTADGLLILQATNCNHQVPAKLYEYLRAGRPILALTDDEGDTAATLRAAGVDTIAPLDQDVAIADAIRRFLALTAQNAAPIASAATVASHSRLARSEKLAALLDKVACEHQAAG